MEWKNNDIVEFMLYFTTTNRDQVIDEVSEFIDNIENEKSPLETFIAFKEWKNNKEK